MTIAEKEKIVNRINTRIRRIADKFGSSSYIMQDIQNRLDAKLGGKPGELKNGLLNVSWTKDDQEYWTISRSASDLEKIDEDTLQYLLGETPGGKKRIPTIGELKKDIAKSMDMGVDAFGKPITPTDAQIQQYINQKTFVEDWFNENSEHIYQLIESTGWSAGQIREKTYQQLVNAINKISGDKNYSEDEKDRLRAQSRERDAKLEAMRKLGLI